MIASNLSLPFVLHPSSFILHPSEGGVLGAFPRGEGLYFDPVKLLLVLAFFLGWVGTCWWVDHDCREIGLPSERWSPLVLAGGVVGLILLWTLPFFWLSLLVLLILYLAPTLIYVGKRNDQVSEDEKILTPAHLSNVVGRWLGKKSALAEKKKVIPIRFVGKSADKRGVDVNRVKRAQESEQYRLALEMVYDAIIKRATDIHLEPTQDEMTVRYRIDGILQSADAMTRDDGDAVLNIFKVLADMDITERRKAQDGSFSAEVQSVTEVMTKEKSSMSKEDGDEEEDEGPVEKVVAREVDFRVATAGSVEGEKMVMRLLDRSRAINDLGRLGMRGKLGQQIVGIVSQPYGLFIVCGPTGAGKSTTLYACLSEIDRFQKNVITVENPVEYHIENVTQIEINPKAGKTFATELRSILRQDPDVIYIGEVRDKETAEIACQAAQTGHMVFTTLHANDTMTAVLRLLNLDIEPFMVASAVSAVLSQRLVRVLCPKCKIAYKPNPEVLRRLNLPGGKPFYRPAKEEDRGEDEGPCAHCSGTGYRGRTGIFELLVVNDKLRDLIKVNPNLDQIRETAMKHGLVLLSQDGMRVVLEGQTSVEELQRVAK